MKLFKTVTQFKDLATGKVYDSIMKAVEDTGDSYHCIYQNLRTKNWTRSGHKYVPVTEEENNGIY